jgi:3-deoxy-D-manno-octulosonic-acid transferase
MLRSAYRFLSDLAGPFLTLWLKVRARRGKEDPSRLSERLGIASMPRPNGPLAWLHAASVGEALSVLPVIAALRDQGWHTVITTGTITSARVLKDRLPAGAIHQFAPLDRRAWVRRFVEYWSPDLVLWTESELWPNTLAAIAAQNIPSVLVNGRLSDRAFRGWKRRQALAAHLVGGFSLILAQSAEDARRFTALGGGTVHAVGNLKFAAGILPVDHAQLDVLREQINNRPVWLAASIHPGEDTAIIDVHRQIALHHPKLLTIAVPRHPDRGRAMASSMANAGLIVARRGAVESISADTAVYVADTMGELGVFYALCDIVFVGKSLAIGGGQNPVEPAQSGCALIFGPDMSNFRDLASELLDCGAALQVTDASTLGVAVSRLLDDTAARTAMIDASRKLMARHRECAAETLTHLKPYLAQSSA